jgi:hypothetical protein
LPPCFQNHAFVLLAELPKHCAHDISVMLQRRHYKHLFLNGMLIKPWTEHLELSVIVGCNSVSIHTTCFLKQGCRDVQLGTTAEAFLQQLYDVPDE